jgi:uncharacterized protein YdhG (YjbR/CyaY superfamily)
MNAKPQTIDEYLAILSPDKRAALERLRKLIKAAAPRALEYITYGIPAFQLDGKPLVGFGAAAKHCSFFPMSSKTVAAHQKQLNGYDTSKATIRFSVDQPLPAALVRMLVKARISEDAKRRAKPQMSRATAKMRDSAKRIGASKSDSEVSVFLRDLEHPLKKEIASVRRTILDVSPAIGEGIKWNAPSFRTTDYFATINLRSRDSLQIIFHLGAKVKDNARRIRIDDPGGLIIWVATDRCLVTLGKGADFRGKAQALQAIVREWIRQI